MPATSALIAILILERPLCLDCIATKSDITIFEADRYLNVLSHSPLQLRLSENGRCRACGEGRLVFSLRRSFN